MRSSYTSANGSTTAGASDASSLPFGLHSNISSFQWRYCRLVVGAHEWSKKTQVQVAVPLLTR